MILLLTLKPAAVWAAEDQKQEETEVPEESRTQEDRELNQVAAEVSAPHALLMEVSTGTVLMEKAADEKVHPSQRDENYDPSSHSGSTGGWKNCAV